MHGWRNYYHMLKKLIEGIDPDWSYDELKEHGRIGLKTTSYGRGFPRVAFHFKLEGEYTYWIEFEYDKSKIRYIEKSNEFGQRVTIYQRHGVWSWLK